MGLMMIWRWRFEPSKTEAGKRPGVCIAWHFLCKLGFGVFRLHKIKSTQLIINRYFQQCIIWHVLMHWSVISAQTSLNWVDLIWWSLWMLKPSFVLKWISNWRVFWGDMLTESNSILLMGICGVENARIGDLCCGLTLWWDRWFSLPLSRKGWLSTSTWAHIPKPFPIMCLPFPSFSRFQISQKQGTWDAKFLLLLRSFSLF